MPVSKERMRELQHQRRLRGRTCEACGIRDAERYHQVAPELRSWAVCSSCIDVLAGLVQEVSRA